MPTRICLPTAERNKLRDALKSGTVTIRDLYGLKSADRRKLLAKYVGDDFAQVVNAKFEAAMVSSQKTAITNWIKSATTAKDPIRRDMLKKVERIREALTTGEQGDFLADLAEMKLGINVTEEEATNIIRLKNEVDKFKMEISPDSPIRSEERMRYGLALDRFKNYVGDLKLQADTLTLKERLELKNIGTDIVDLAGTAKSMIASLDNSFIGRQGIKTLLKGDYKIWADSFKTSFKLFGEEMMAKSPKGLFKDRDDAVMAALRADIWSRPNALNGKYAAAKNGYGLGQFHEEAFPTSIPSMIPGLGKVFKASESAFTGSALKMRAELADSIIAAAEANGVDMLDEKQATAFGSLVGSLTGRGELTTTTAMGREINAVMFAPRFLKSNFNTLTAHMFDKTMTPQARRVAAMSTLKIASSIGAIMTMANILSPGSAELDPRSTNFGKIKLGDRRFDITGGMAGLVTLASRINLIGSFHNGEWGYWSKDKSGVYTKMNQGEFGETTAWDHIINFFAGKLSPLASVFRDAWKGQKYSGEKPTIINTITGLTVPISVQILEEELAKGNDDILFMMIAEGLGFSSSDDTFGSYGKKWKEFEEKRGTEAMNKALKQLTDRFNKRVDQLQSSPQWDKMTNDQQKEALEKIKTEETNRILGN